MRTSRFLSLSFLASVAAAIAMAPGAQAADDYFLRIEGVAGETPAGKVTDAIQIKSFEWGTENPVTIGSMTGGAGTGKATFGDLKIEKNIDSTSPQLFQKLGQGAVIPSMELVARRAGTPNPAAGIYMRYCFAPVFVAAQTQQGAGGNDTSTETVTFKFGAAQQTYTRQSPSGQPLGNVFASWNMTTNSPAMTIAGSNPCSSSRF